MQQQVNSIYPAFDRKFLASDEAFTVIGSGELGGKAKGLAFIKRIIAEHCPPGTFHDVEISIPTLTVLTTDVFGQFMEQNGLYEIALSDAPDDRIAHAFQKAELPPLVVGDLRALIAKMHTPLAIRSSSLLEDALSHPFAGTYATKMVPNNQATVDNRFRRLVEAIKFVYASTFFRDAKAYMRAIGRDSRDERMAVIIQEVVGQRFNDRFYPTISGVIRTYNSYPSGPARPADGVVNLALGLGKTIVDGGVNWAYSPAFPRHGPPFGSTRDLVKNTQTRFWAVNMGPAAAYDPINEAEYLRSGSLEDAESAAGDLLADLKIPNTWYVMSDGLHNFVYCNHLEDVFSQKYKDIDQVRQEYPDIVQVFKHSHFSSDVVKGLSVALDDFGERPLIVRSSSLLEDRFGAAFSGKYKSLFLANQGGKQERLNALTDAIAEVYASTFGPDPIEYRAERNLLDFQEGMGILIQEVVGTKVGHYFLPAFAGVAFGHNEFRWSPRIKREDGLVRMVPGLGTRAVDRLSNDYPTLVSPGQPGLRANATAEETAQYSPRYMDVINLSTSRFETVGVTDFLRETGNELPGLEQLVSVYDQGNLRQPLLGQVDCERDDLVVTFEGLLTRTPFVKRIHALLALLEEKLQTPVDVEFAHDGKHLYLLQCRAQNPGKRYAPASIPRDIPRERLVFSANRHVSNGTVPNITHIVYVDPESYAQMGSLEELKSVGRAVSKLNKVLPKRQFVLMGPGRWGSRGDIKLGISVTYSDINNTAMLIEIARRKGDYTPDLSFGTHFFQDLVEASIRYLPLYPDEESVAFNEPFLTRSGNMLADLAPAYASLADTVYVIDVPRAADGQVLRVLMNADLDEAVGVLVPSAEVTDSFDEIEAAVEPQRAQHWRWRLHMAERIAAQLSPDRYGVHGFYVFGSTKNATAGPASDIDVLIHFRGADAQREVLERWLDGWSRCLSEMNYLRTGHKTDGLLDVHIVTDEDIANGTSYAVKISAVTDAARPLPLMGEAPDAR